MPHLHPHPHPHPHPHGYPIPEPDASFPPASTLKPDASRVTVTSALASGKYKSPSTAAKALYPLPPAWKRFLLRWKIKEELTEGRAPVKGHRNRWRHRHKTAGEPSPADIEDARRFGGYAETEKEGRPSELYLKILSDCLLTLDRSPLCDVVSPPLIATTGILPLSIFSTGPDIIGHYFDCIVSAKKEVVLLTNYWQRGENVETISRGLRELNAKLADRKKRWKEKLEREKAGGQQDKKNKEGNGDATPNANGDGNGHGAPPENVETADAAPDGIDDEEQEPPEKIVVKIMWDRGPQSLKDLFRKRQYCLPSNYKSNGLPSREEVPNLDMEVLNYHRPLMGTFHCKILLVDRQVALVNSNNIQDRPNLEACVRLEGDIVNSVYDHFLLTWGNEPQPAMPCIADPAPAQPPPEAFGPLNETLPKMTIDTLRDAAQRARDRLNKNDREAHSPVTPSHPSPLSGWPSFHGAFGMSGEDHPGPGHAHDQGHGAQGQGQGQGRLHLADVVEAVMKRGQMGGGSAGTNKNRPASAGQAEKDAAKPLAVAVEKLKAEAKLDNPAQSEGAGSPKDATPAVEGGEDGAGSAFKTETEKILFQPQLAQESSADDPTSATDGSSAAATPDVRVLTTTGESSPGAGAANGEASQKETATSHLCVPSSTDPAPTGRVRSSSTASSVRAAGVTPGSEAVQNHRRNLSKHSNASVAERLGHITRSLNFANNSPLKGYITPDDEQVYKQAADFWDFTPFVFHRPHAPFPMTLVNRRPHGTPGHSDIRNPQDAAWLAAMRYARKVIFIQSPTLNASPIKAAVLGAARRHVKVILWLDLGFNDKSESLPFQGGTNEEVVSMFYKTLRKEGKGDEKYLEVYWYTGKDMTRPLNAVRKQRNCHVKFMAVDDEVGIIGSGNQDTQSWFHSQEINVMCDSKQIVKEWITALQKNQSTGIYGKVDQSDGIWRGREGNERADKGD